ncbi:MAG: hypothetical protein LBR74_00585 [Eubacterium sp.]|jgi:isocitrate dehydrogenase kinase/phosphatase|nr:hypothetical protein [Eubacterium sp.]
MLQVLIPAHDVFDNERQEFLTVKPESFQIEHSLVSVSKWESKWKKPFLSKYDKTDEETVDYIRCMTITQNVDTSVYKRISTEMFSKITDYINDSMTATWFNDKQDSRRNREIITAEIIYYWMIALNIPWECQKWHLNRLLTLIRVCNIKNQPPKKRGRKSALAERQAINKARRQQYNTKG